VSAGPPTIDLRWPHSADDAVRAQVHRVATGVMERGGAVGWLGVPTRAESDAWLDGILAAVAAGSARLAVAVVAGDGGAGRIEALGRWVRYEKPVVAVNADVQQVMVHPAARGRGLARAVVTALVADARRHGVETLTLDTRGNNHAAMALYESLGFAVRGRLRDFVAVGDERWDRVLYALDLRTADAPLRRHGAAAIGPGASHLR
jgi:ribosomal protein S18 acetylase RimI-like enzyme